MVALTPAEGFLFHNRIKGYRLPKATGGGLKTGYSAQRFGDLEPFTGAEALPASIQAQRAATTNPPGLPTDTPRSAWFILLPARFAAPGTFRQGDVIVDELEYRYTVTADYRGPLGWRLHAFKEEA